MGGGCQVAVGVHREGDTLYIFHQEKHSEHDLSGMSQTSAMEKALCALGQE